MQQASERKRDALIRNMLLLDAVALLLLFGKGITIPGLNIELGDVPAARDALIFLASLSFQFFALAFVNWQGYGAIIDTISKHRTKKSGVDPDFLSAAYKFLEFTIKVYRGNMNIGGMDFASPNGAYKVFSWIVITLVLASVLSLLCLHLTVVFASARETIMTVDGSALLYAYILFLLLSNLGGLLVLLSLNISFEFLVPLGGSTPQTSSPERSSGMEHRFAQRRPEEGGMV